MARKLKKPVVLFAKVEIEAHDKLRMLAFNENKSMANLVREALDLFIKKHRHKKR
ncbi:MAG: hypothetical protein Q7K16_02170 [Candidatus Azambacteria bacterium]|nr:hypothetical protein [Candidatus Azambacteria bacterium]